MHTKQVIVLRIKYPDGKGGTKGVRAGKLAAQAGHVSALFLINRIHDLHNMTFWQTVLLFFNWLLTKRKSFVECALRLSDAEKDWLLTGKFTKICVQVDSEEELIKIVEQAKDLGVEANIITDCGATEFGGVPTRTAVAVGPDLVEKVDSITKHLKLY